MRTRRGPTCRLPLLMRHALPQSHSPQRSRRASWADDAITGRWFTRLPKVPRVAPIPPRRRARVAPTEVAKEGIERSGRSGTIELDGLVVITRHVAASVIAVSNLGRAAARPTHMGGRPGCMPACCSVGRSAHLGSSRSSRGATSGLSSRWTYQRPCFIKRKRSRCYSKSGPARSHVV